jgi:hypothetical protein
MLTSVECQERADQKRAGATFSPNFPSRRRGWPVLPGTIVLGRRQARADVPRCDVRAAEYGVLRVVILSGATRSGRERDICVRVTTRSGWNLSAAGFRLASALLDRDDRGVSYAHPRVVLCLLSGEWRPFSLLDAGDL